MFSISRNQVQIKNASKLIVFLAKTNFSDEYIDAHIKNVAVKRNQTISELDSYKELLIRQRETRAPQEFVAWTKRQVYLALGTLLMAAAVKKIDACPMEAFDEKEADKILDTKKLGLSVAVMCALGYRAKTDKYAKTKKVRFSKKQIIKTIK